MKLFMRIAFVCVAAYVCQTHLQAVVSARVTGRRVSTMHKNIFSQGAAWHPCPQPATRYHAPTVHPLIKQTPHLHAHKTRQEERGGGARQKVEPFQKKPGKTNRSQPSNRGLLVGGIAVLAKYVAENADDAIDGAKFTEAETQNILPLYGKYIEMADAAPKGSVAQHVYYMIAFLIIGDGQAAGDRYYQLLINEHSPDVEQIFKNPGLLALCIKMRALSFFPTSYYRRKGHASWDATMSGLFVNFLNKIVIAQNKKIADLLTHVRIEVAEKQKIIFYKQLQLLLSEHTIVTDTGDAGLD
ncbi:MAG: hypothetical protein WCE21_03320 [Candidatus Babeliales bacterium]